ncbi:hypothetical protein OG413_30125 [Streptomyces sp. NBC_01433]|uniref:hypothetical protein n=1 Tax=Streptomyces sp. NBC_01433 TaxID=2903864 RepID=UPI0022516545|nr:hypothetical protein [Streptomyces sp. NBC_01433]MCX4679493.1 hypothetical protein [Streptomyces sp. NBC_01433]
MGAVDEEDAVDGAEPSADALADAYDKALRGFAHRLRAVHLDSGTPPLRQISRGARREVPLSPAAVSEALNGKRLPSQQFTLELVRLLAPGDHAKLEEFRKLWRTAREAQIAARAAARARQNRAGGGPLPDGARTASQDAEEISAAAERLREDAAAVPAEARREAKTTRTGAEPLLRASGVTTSAPSAGTRSAEAIVAAAREEANAILTEAARQADRVWEALESQSLKMRREIEQSIRRREEIQLEIARVQDVLEALDSFYEPSVQDTSGHRPSGQAHNAPWSTAVAGGVAWPWPHADAGTLTTRIKLNIPGSAPHPPQQPPQG